MSTETLGRRERKREQTASHLAATAFRLFEAHGFESVAMEQIAAEADVAKGTLYNYFPVKEALLAHQFRTEIASGMAALHPALAQHASFGVRMANLIKASAYWNTSRRKYLPHYLRFRLSEIGVPSSPDPAHRSGTHHILERLFSDGQRQGQVRTDIAATELAWLFEFMCVGAVMVWLGRSEDSLERHFSLALEVLLSGVAVSDSHV